MLGSVRDSASLPLEILVIASDNAAAAHLEHCFQGSEDGDFYWSIAESLPAGLAKLSEETFDAILLDLPSQNPAQADRIAIVQDHAGTLPVLSLSDLEEDKGLVRRRLKQVVTEKRRSDELACELEEVRIAQQRLAAIIDENPDGIILVARDETVSLANPAAHVLLGHHGKELVGQVFGFPIAAGKRAELDIVGKSGDTRVVEMLVSDLELDNESSSLASLRDITQLAQLRDHMQTLSLTDELTGLYNRRGWSALAQQQLLLAKRVRVPVMLIYADLDGLKGINDSFGHATGDEALVRFADVLKAVFRESDLIARVGGDEFAVLPISAQNSSEHIIRTRVEHKLEDWNASTERQYKLSASIGVAYWDPESDQTLDDAIRSADESMYEEKARHNDKGETASR